MYKQKKIAYNKYKRKVKEEKMKVIDKIALVLIIIGAINWGLIGFFNLIFGELNEEEKAIIEEKLIETYKRKNITFNDNSLYKQDPEKIIGKIFKKIKICLF